ncbi:hypothetical protein AMTR_s00022p00251770 [Amborella trichopoda]|uniref:Uncharacterized protein n=1 Tax=Amborella trichopoda TaxID=13333 RepID=W1PVR1_AMBTC|nr:hypothetical protein AMTR_s00022p00251770 [Amborella trichopoda]
MDKNRKSDIPGSGIPESAKAISKRDGNVEFTRVPDCSAALIVRTLTESILFTHVHGLSPNQTSQNIATNPCTNP